MKNIKQINIYLVDGSRYVVIPSDDNLAKYVKGNLFINLFPFIEWEDSEPTSIEYVLKNCEMIDDESNE